LYDEGFKLFSSIFGEIKHRFISSNEFGLDSNLSLKQARIEARAA
jgi:hypothetical protein